MLKKTGQLLVVASVALNLAFVSAFGGLYFSARAERGDQADMDNGVWCRLHRRLGVTEEQWKQIEPLLMEFRESARAASEDVGRARGELIDLIASSEPDMQAIRAKQEEIQEAHSRMQKLVVEHLLAEKRLLTEEQQERLFAMMRERAGCPGRWAIRGGMAPRFGTPGGGPDLSN